MICIGSQTGKERDGMNADCNGHGCEKKVTELLLESNEGAFIRSLL